MNSARARALVVTLLASFTFCAVAAAEPTVAGDGAPCTTCIRIRVGLPRVVRGPSADIADNRFNEVALPGGRFRGFDAHGDTRAIDGRSPSDMAGAERVVLRAGKPGTYDACGQWLNHAEPNAAGLIGFVHAETACDYRAGQTHKSMSLATSPDDGLTWTNVGQIITGSDRPTPKKNTGEGDCTAVKDRDGFFYAYCYRARDGALIVARAPVSDARPGMWKKFFGGTWEQPGLGGNATRLMSGSGSSVAAWAGTGEDVLTGWVRGGLGLFFTADHTTMTRLAEPLLPVDPGVWKRPAPSELIAYPVILDAKTGANRVSDSWMLVYAYVAPNEDGTQKYLVFRNVDVTRSATPVSPQAGVLLARWYDPALHDRWSTTAAVPDAAYAVETTSGYLMTAASAGRQSVELEDCVSTRTGHPDHLLARTGFCETHAYRRLRTAGWVYAERQPNAQPLYQCYADAERSHFAANRPDCDGKGRMELLLGYDLIR